MSFNPFRIDKHSRLDPGFHPGLLHNIILFLLKHFAMIKLLGLPFDENSSFLRGPASAPDILRHIWHDGASNDFAENLVEVRENGVWEDAGNLTKSTETTAAYFNSITEKIKAIVNNGHRPLCIGGDHSLTFPVIRGFAERYNSLHILHIDAHPDLYHNFEDNYYSHASPFARIMENRFAVSLTQIGIRTLNRHQKQQADKFGVKQFGPTGWSIDDIKALKGPLYISVDLDGLDPAFAPGVSHHEPGGLATRELLTIIQQTEAEIVGADIVEYNPSRDINYMTARVAYKVAKELMAKMI
jgi:arginase